MSNFFDGAVMAYRDREELAIDLAEKLPPELQFLKPQFEELANGFGKKANEVLKLVNERKK